MGFILAAAGSAVGLGNIWGFPTQVASNGGAAFLFIYLLCAFAIGFPVMVAEITMGRKTGRNPVGAFKVLGNNKLVYSAIGMWGLICGVMILAFYTVIAGWTVSYVFEEVFFYLGMTDWASWISNTGNGPINAVFATVFMGATISIILGGVSDGIERATKFMMPLLLIILVVMIGYVVLQPGAGVGLEVYLFPDFSKVTPDLVLSAMGQAFFSLSLGMGALITYGSYLSKKENIPEAAAYVTLMDAFIAFLAGLLVIPTMYMAQAQGVPIFDDSGNLLASAALIFQVLPELFHEMGGLLGLIFGGTFFFLLSIAALTSTISLLEVPVSYAIDEHGLKRKSAATYIGGGVLAISLIISFDTSLIDHFVFIFNEIGLPLGGFLICLFLGYYWKTDNALAEMQEGYPTVMTSFFARVWPVFVKVIAPLAILYNLLSGLGII
ncbi:neurotransmitter:Na+ symporter, NSS family [Fodinibius roseus]|uniref:Neurotransmitter:Na+ symporter, NSS family n=2 Tax=Fodinibius roseus TaxID=1194090 RepID=A0A1M4T2H7_9BACT|nr:neurotransmitter:Na+ symporter, NSS family [Fodinibius roseus]